MKIRITGTVLECWGATNLFAEAANGNENIKKIDVNAHPLYNDSDDEDDEYEICLDVVLQGEL